LAGARQSVQPALNLLSCFQGMAKGIGIVPDDLWHDRHNRFGANSASLNIYLVLKAISALLFCLEQLRTTDTRPSSEEVIGRYNVRPGLVGKMSFSGKDNGSYPFTPLSIITSTHEDIRFPPPNIGPDAPKYSCCCVKWLRQKQTWKSVPASGVRDVTRLRCGI